jgi:CHAD domain-containing protein
MGDRRGGGTVGELVVAYLSAQSADLVSGATALREGKDAIHPTRVAIRRWRASLKSFGHLFEAEQTASLDESLAWYGRLLGAARDYEVLRQYLSGVIADLEPALVVGPVARDIDQ